MTIPSLSLSKNPLEIAVEIAQGAAEIILGFYRDDTTSVTQKSDGSPITAADQGAHDFILEQLQKRFPYPVHSEEGPVEYAQRQNWTRHWLVDPLDGTKDFLAKNDEFTVNIALIEKDEPVLGVVAVPACGVTYFAERGSGTHRISNGVVTRITNTRQGPPAICLESRFHASPGTQRFCKRVGIQEVHTFGSALKLCKLAEGEADIYTRFNPTKEWDVGASHCILNEAGCFLVDMKSLEELRYNRVSLVNPPFIAARRNVECELSQIFQDGKE